MRTLKENLYAQIEQQVKVAGLAVSLVDLQTSPPFVVFGFGLSTGGDLLLVHPAGRFDVYFALCFGWTNYEAHVFLISGRQLKAGTQTGKPKKAARFILRTQKAADGVFKMVARGLRDVPILEKLASAGQLDDEPETDE